MSQYNACCMLAGLQATGGGILGNHASSKHLLRNNNGCCCRCQPGCFQW